MITLRRTLESQYTPSQTQQPGLWLDIAMPNCTQKEGAKADHLEKVCNLIDPSLLARYKVMFDSRKADLSQYRGMIEEGHTHHFIADFKGRMVIDLGAESVLETSCARLRAYGLPYLPGSSLKGLTARFAAQKIKDPQWKMDFSPNGDMIRQGQAHKDLFGSHTDAEEQSAGLVVFHDAWWIPGHDNQSPYQLDVMTPHYASYNLNGADWPADWLQPNPVPFLTVTGKFLIALSGPKEWITCAAEILKLALIHEGIGAKTNIGYGRIKDCDWEDCQKTTVKLADNRNAKIAKHEEKAARTANKYRNDGKTLKDMAIDVFFANKINDILPLHEKYPHWADCSISPSEKVSLEDLRKVFEWSKNSQEK